MNNQDKLLDDIEMIVGKIKELHDLAYPETAEMHGNEKEASGRANQPHPDGDEIYELSAGECRYGAHP